MSASVYQKLINLCVICAVVAWTPVQASGLPVYAPGEILVQWSTTAAKPTAVAHQALRELTERYGIQRQDPLFPPLSQGTIAHKHAGPIGARVGRSSIGRWSRLTFSAAADPLEVAQQYAALESVVEAQPNYLRRFASVPPDDPQFSEQWNLLAMGWEAETAVGGDAVLVAVIDSGLDLTHTDIVQQVWVNAAEENGTAGIDDDGNGYIDDISGWDFVDAPGLPGTGDFLDRDADPTDESGHGTHVTGIIAASVGNGFGIAGIAPGVRIMPLRAGFNVSGSGHLQDDDIAAAIVYAADNGARIINMSFGDPHPSQLLRDAVRYATDAGCVCVAAAGNEGSNEVFYPARLDETIAVAASDAAGRILSFSNRGFSIDLAAPGLRIASLEPGGFGVRSGTSMAAAHVSGVAALILARNPHFTPSRVRSSLANQALDLAPAGWDARSGAGIVQVPEPVTRPPVGVRILSPLSDTDLGDAALVRVAAMGRAGEGGRLEVSWGRGVAPVAWTELLSVGVAEGEMEVEVIWPTTGLADGIYLIRATISAGPDDDSGGDSDRVALRLRRRPTAIEGLTWLRALAGASWDYLLEWTTDAPAGGTVKIRSDRGGLESGDALYEIGVEPGRRQHVLTLPDDLPRGSYVVEVDAGSKPGGGRGEGSFTTVEIAERGLLKWDLASRGRIPGGYLMPFARDLDDNGLAEIVEMVFADGGGGGYRTTSFFELGIGAGAGTELVHTTSLTFIPWNVHDLDGDGRAELMAVDAERVRLLEAEREGAFPSRAVWEQRDVWGGETADLDGDGIPEMYLRSSRAELFRVFEAAGDDLFQEVATLANPTTGTNGLGDRQVVGDLDGDGLGELLAGDDDGDLFVYESVGDNAFRVVWYLESDVGDTRLLGGPADLDADGEVEFVSASLRRDPLALGDTRWLVTVYGSPERDRFEPEFSVVVLGGKPGGNGIALGDLDGDGTVEFTLALVPDLYVFHATSPGHYEPVWHAASDDPHRPLIADLDGDGGQELAFNGIDGVEVYVVPERLPLAAPGSVAARPVRATAISLRWEPVSGAAAYRLYRGDGNGDLLTLVGSVTGTAFEDAGLVPGKSYHYAVSALTSQEIEGFRSAVVTAQPVDPPEVVGVERLARHQLGLTFDAPMASSVTESYRYRLEPEIGQPSSVVADRGGLRVVLSFPLALPDSGIVTLKVSGLRGASGAALSAADSSISLGLAPLEHAARILRARVHSPISLSLFFSAPVRLTGEEVFEVDGGRIAVVGAVVSGSEVVVELAPETPLRPAGRRYEIYVIGLRDERDLPVEGRIFVSVAAAGLGEVTVFPNPFDPTRQELTFAGLPLDTKIYILTTSGEVIRVLEEADGDGGVQWDGRNASGRPVQSGIYLFVASHGGLSQDGKVAVLRR